MSVANPTIHLSSWLTRPVSIAPLVVFRILFGLLMLVNILRFMAKGWVKQLYIDPQFYFKYYGFEWVHPLGGNGMYIVFVLMGLSALFLLLGWYYKVSSTCFFLLFTYVELLDQTNYLNHYYFVSIISFLLIWVPAHRYFSLDVWRKPGLLRNEVPFWTVNIFKLQMGILYFFAGVAKLNPDWLLRAMPLKIWLPAKADFPLIGPVLSSQWAPYLFCWTGAVYDLSIAFLLLLRKVRPYAYTAVVLFHLATGLLFQIGMFPYIMIGITLIFFPASFHQQIIDFLEKALKKILGNRFIQIKSKQSTVLKLHPKIQRLAIVFLIAHFSLQLFLPMRYALYPNKLFWTEQGFRFSWRVMLMEKAGYATFHVQEVETGKTWMVSNSDYLTPYQEKMMATQPDMILQYAHFLEDEYKKKGLESLKVTVECYVTLNGKPSTLLIDPEKDLTKLNESFKHKSWILPFEE
ncbi:HTTM domain-containing protein [Rapidithrix thailandica]|uniref:HTTM domain-containing protein n=1 Tax=Rapidithrix thailandica TaxID=413964 RepID=A0AAW9SCC8_9BACT